MDLKNIQRLKSSLNEITKNKNVLDVILFGSFIKGKLNSNDIDIAIISETGKLNIDLTSSKYQNFHFSIISIENFFLTHISLVNTIFREGYSIKYDKPFSELFKFSSKILFSIALIMQFQVLSNINNFLSSNKEKRIDSFCQVN